tara:strand:+ start:694 stop:1566 length:873 start_codon:yes stop_codon:yes gene_type:complete
MTENTCSQLVHATSVDEAITLLTREGPFSLPVAGATWIMRAPTRREETDRLFVSLGQIDALKKIEINYNQISIGSLVTHDTLSKLEVGGHDLDCLRQAALKSANPAIRNAATIGGNICSYEFAAADLVPALLSLDAQVEVQGQNGITLLEIGDFLQSRETKPNDQIVTKILIKRSDRISAHARLLIRQAGDYPVVTVSCSLSISDDGRIRAPRIAVGSVESVARRWLALEDLISGQSLADLDIKKSSSSFTSDFNGRNGSDATGQYRLKVLPKVAAQALEKIQMTQKGAM